MVLERHEDGVILPFGLVALYWLKAYMPLVLTGTAPARAVADRPVGFPQQHNPDKGLGFVRDAFRALAPVSPHDLRVGGRFTGADARNLLRALNDICSNITRMPANYTTYPGSDLRVFEARPARVRADGAIRVNLDRRFLSRFGTFRVPAHLWEAISRYACWIEPVVVGEWCNLMREYDEKRDVIRPTDDYRRALTWLEPERDTSRVRERVELLRSSGKHVYCVWSGTRLRTRFAIDHCFPFSFWPNNDLWNLLPASEAANQKKSDRLPSAELLHRCRDRILQWWDEGYGSTVDRDRFRMEAFSSLPMTGVLARDSGATDAADLHDSVFIGVDSQRVRLRADQQLAEWDGPLTSR